MSDRELLEFAAKAAGVHCKGWAMPGARSDGWHGMYTGSDDDGAYLRWNPITDDGDALRLAVELRLMDEVSVMNSQYESVNPLAATRRAIVRAAAEIGRSMK